MNYSNYINWKNWREEDFGLVLPGSKFQFDQIFRKVLNKTTILEIGFGNGELLSYFRNLGHQVIGVEINEDLVRRAKKNDYIAYTGAIWDIEELESKKFDLIVALDVAEHLNYKELTALFSWARNHLNVGGLLLLRFPEGSSPLSLGYQNGDFTHLTCLTQTKINILCDSSNMKLQSYEDELLVSNRLCSFGLIGRLVLIFLQCLGRILKLLIRIILFPVCPSLKLSTNSIAVMTVKQ